MKKIILITVILALAFGVWYLNKIQNEKAIFNGKTKRQVLKILREKWESEYKRTQKLWILNNADAEEVAVIQEKAGDNGVTYDEQVINDVNWLYEFVTENRHPYRVSESDSTKVWRKTWVIAQAENMGIDTSLQEAQDMLYKV